MPNKPQGAVGGAHTFIERGPLLEQVAKKHGIDPACKCLKIGYKFFLEKGQMFYEFNWGGNGYSIVQCADLQNLCADKGLAPRVYVTDTIDWEGKRAVVQIQDYAGEGEGANPELFKKVIKVIRENGGDYVNGDGDGGTWNSAGGKWVGFKGAYFI